MDVLSARGGASSGRYLGAGAIVFVGRLIGCVGLAYSLIMIQGASAVARYDSDANCPVLAGQMSCEEDPYNWHYASPIFFLFAAVVAGVAAVTVLRVTTPLARRVLGSLKGAKGAGHRELVRRVLWWAVAPWAAFGAMWGITMSGATTEWQFFEPWLASRASSGAYVPIFGGLLAASILGGFLLRRGGQVATPVETYFGPPSTRGF